MVMEMPINRPQQQNGWWSPGKDLWKIAFKTEKGA